MAYLYAFVSWACIEESILGADLDNPPGRVRMNIMASNSGGLRRIRELLLFRVIMVPIYSTTC